jgi:cytochrome oxidase Cu insertion factor (SCO1/SenC/PrrC family)
MLKRTALVLCALLGALTVLPACGAGTPATTGPLKTGYHTGNLAPDFTLFDLDGQPVSLSGFLGRPVVVNFWATD